jgi:hypothetical protein
VTISSYPRPRTGRGKLWRLELVPLCTMRLTAKPPVEVGAGPAGTRLVFDETSVQVHGDRLRGQLEGAANDCVLVGPEGNGLALGPTFSCLPART